MFVIQLIHHLAINYASMLGMRLSPGDVARKMAEEEDLPLDSVRNAIFALIKAEYLHVTFPEHHLMVGPRRLPNIGNVVTHESLS